MEMSRKKQDIILENIEIESVAAEGKALARVDGTVLFVQFAVPGDIVDVKVTKKKKNYMEGYILRLVKPSAQAGAVLQSLRYMRRMQVAASPLRNAAPGETAAGL